MKILVCGGRNYKNSTAVNMELGLLLDSNPVEAVIQGGSKGADRLAKKWAIANEIPCIEYRANWAEHGLAAGPIRNQLMLNAEQPDLVLAFPGGSGTADMVNKAKRAGVKVIEYTER